MTDTDRTPPITSEPSPVVANVDGIPISGLLVRPPSPRATLIALHGGGTTSAYYDCPDHPELSLMRLAAQLGYAVLALDRPGYGESAAHTDELSDPRRRTDLIYAAITHLLRDASSGAGLFLVAHSMGVDLALRMAADPRGSQFLGLELAGTGTQPQREARQVLWGHADEAPRLSGRELSTKISSILWGPSDAYPDDITGARLAFRGPRFDAHRVESWHDVYTTYAPHISVPLRISIGEQDRVWRNDSGALADLGVHFTAAPRILINRQPRSGHNLSVGVEADNYHRGLLTFVDRCIGLRAEQDTAPSDARISTVPDDFAAQAMPSRPIELSTATESGE